MAKKKITLKNFIFKGTTKKLYSQVKSTKGISISEQYSLRLLAKIDGKNSPIERDAAFELAQTAIEDHLGRVNITPKDMRLAIVAQIIWS